VTLRQLRHGLGGRGLRVCVGAGSVVGATTDSVGGGSVTDGACVVAAGKLDDDTVVGSPVDDGATVLVADGGVTDGVARDGEDTEVGWGSTVAAGGGTELGAGREPGADVRGCDGSEAASATAGGSAVPIGAIVGGPMNGAVVGSCGPSETVGAVVPGTSAVLAVLAVRTFCSSIDSRPDSPASTGGTTSNTSPSPPLIASTLRFHDGEPMRHAPVSRRAAARRRSSVKATRRGR
jgi:hypothetical protein